MRVGTFFTEMTAKTFFDTLQGSIWAPFWMHFGDFGFTFGSKGGPWEVLEGSENDVEKGTL